VTENGHAAPGKREITIERTFHASQDEVWEMWTTKEGVESWWGPDGFAVTVRGLACRVGGRLDIVMEATAPGPIAMLERSGQSLVSVSVCTFTEIVPTSRIALVTRVDFIPGREPYNVACSVELVAVPDGTRMTFRSEPMHDEHWTWLATAGWESSFDRLANLLNKHS
jgi:uncharacterized protein YndB with AHSA1/START domain